MGGGLRIRGLRSALAGPFDIDIEPGLRGGDLDIERLVRAAHPIRQHLRDGGRPVEARRQHRAGLHGDQIMATRSHEADYHRLTLAAGMKGDAAAPDAMSIDQRGDRSSDAGALQRGHDLPALPFAIEPWCHVLSGTAPAASEERADRGDAGIGGRNDLDELAAFAIDHRAHGFARQSIGNEDAAGRRPRDAVPTLAQVVDGENFIHGELWRRIFSGLRLCGWHCSELGAFARMLMTSARLSPIRSERNWEIRP